MTCVRLSATLVTLNFDYVSSVLRPRLVANVNSSVSSCVEHWKNNDKVLQWFHIVFASIQQHNALHFYTAGSGHGSDYRQFWWVGSGRGSVVGG